MKRRRLHPIEFLLLILILAWLGLSFCKVLGYSQNTRAQHFMNTITKETNR